MDLELKQFVPSPVCLRCEGCCRFIDPKSCWRPRVTEEETKARPGPKGLDFPASIIDEDRALQTIPWQGKHICYFFHPNQNTCGIYPHRPFECRLYPFVISKKGEGLVLNVHLACPHIQGKRYTPEFDEYLAYLKTFFKRKATVRFMKKYFVLNPGYAGHELELEELCPIDLGPNP